MEDSAAVDVSDCVRLPLGSLPVLVYNHGTGSNKRQTAFCVADQSTCTQVVPELTENDFHVTQHGWVFLHDPASTRTTRLWDPRSGENVALPDMERDMLLPARFKCFLSDAPTAASCVVLVLCDSEPRLLYCHVGNDRWTEHEYDVGTVPLPPEYAPPTKWVIQQTAAVGGRFYFLETGQLGVLEFLTPRSEPEFTFHDYPHPAFPTGSNAASSYLVASSRDELFDVRVFLKRFSPEVLTVHVYKVVLVSSGPPTLCKVDDLGDRVLLLSYPNAQLLCSASRYGLKRNHVYFMHDVMEEPDGGLLHIYA